MNIKNGVYLFKKTFSEFGDDNVMSWAAALAYYSVLSLAPLLLILLTVAGFFSDATRQSVVQRIERQAGPQAGQAIGAIVENLQQAPTARTISGIFGIAVLLFAATGVFSQMQHTLNYIWKVRSKSSVKGFFKKRLLCLLAILGMGVLLLASIVLSAVLNYFLAGAGYVWQAVDLAVNLGIFVVIFAFVFKYFPDANIAWRDVWFGAGVTAVLFVAGKWLISLYLGHSSVSSGYGAAGSLIILLIWIYYSAIILFLGAEVTQVWARRKDRAITPQANAEWLPGAHAY